MIVVTHEMGFAREVSGEVIFLHDAELRNRIRRENFSRILNPSVAGSFLPAASELTKRSAHEAAPFLSKTT